MTDYTATGVLTTVGKAQIAAILAGTSTDPFTKMQLGSGSTIAAAANTDLVAAHASTLVTATKSVINTDQVQFYKQFTFSTTTVVREIGIKSTAGILLCRAVLDSDVSCGEGTLYNFYVICDVGGT